MAPEFGPPCSSRAVPTPANGATTPKAFALEPELQVYPDRCIGCGSCLEACSVGAHRNVNGEKVYYRDRCIRCGKCADGCYAQSLVMAGEPLTADQIMAEVMKDEVYYGPAGDRPESLSEDLWRGGVTLSGGEPALVGEILAPLLRQFKENGVHTTIQTAGSYPWSTIEPILSLVDLFMYDVKVWDSDLHQQFVGIKPDRIRENLQRLCESGAHVIVRTPVVGGVNDLDSEIESIARFVGALPNVLYYELLPYHVLGGSKLASLGLEPGTAFTTPTSARMNQLAALANQHITTRC